MIYIDTSCLIQLVREEPDTEAIGRAVADEDLILLSSLADVETVIDLRCGRLAGNYSTAKWREYKELYERLRASQPFEIRTINSDVWAIAIRQTEDSIYCRTLDRLHLAAAELFGATRIMTLDTSQAKAARALGFQVISPR